MSERAITLQLLEDFGLAVKTTPEELDSHIRLVAALKLFELGGLLSGKAVELAGLSRVDFFEICGRYRVSVVNCSPEELQAELASDLAAAKKASR